MRKKSLMTMTAGLVLVGAAGLGATLAYLSDVTGPVTNTFTFSQTGITIKLDEVEVDEYSRIIMKDGEEKRTETGNNYQNIIPGLTVAKDPTVTVDKNSLNCNVFVSVTNANAEDVLVIDDLNADAWSEVDPADYNLTAADDTTYYVYMGNKATEEVKEAGDSFAVVAKSNEQVVLEDVFTTVTFGTDIDEDTDFVPVIIKAAAVQADSCSDDAAAVTALGMLLEND